MAEHTTRALSEVLDHLEKSIQGEKVRIASLVDELGHHSFASLMLMFALVSASPASSIPGITAMVAAVEFVLILQMLLGRTCLWLPTFISRKTLSARKLCTGVNWLRKPVHFVERFLKPRLVVFIKPPWLYLSLVLILAVTLFMPFMEAIPTSGSIASAAIACFAAGLLTRDGLLAMVSIGFLAAVPVMIWSVGFSG
ncbi:exopolysaccharide biosynthesis protein [Vreelandella sp. EE22]